MSKATQSNCREKAIKSIATLNPEDNYEAIARYLYAYEFSWDIERSLEFALFRTYAVPSISELLAKTGEFEIRPQKRYDDTELLLAEIIEHGLDSNHGQRSISRINAMHARFQIENADMLYVLSTFICEPIRWLHRFGRRPMTENEERAWFLYYRGLGLRMGIKEIPLDLDTIMRWNISYEANRFQYANTNQRISEATIKLLLGFYLPHRFHWAGKLALRALLDPPLLNSMGLRPVPV